MNISINLKIFYTIMLSLFLQKYFEDGSYVSDYIHEYNASFMHTMNIILSSLNDRMSIVFH